jgi:ankyrin repeat protein
MNPLEFRDTLNIITSYIPNPQNLLVNQHMLQLLYNHPDLVFIRNHMKSDIPKYGLPKFLCIYTNSDSLEIAVEYGNTELVKHLAYPISNPHWIQTASKNGHLELIKYLVSIQSYSMNLADVTANNNCAIQYASKNGHLEIVKYLVSQKADVTANNNYAIQWASKNGHLETVKYLVSQGADVTANNNYAIQYASWYGHLEIVKYLVS